MHDGRFCQAPQIGCETDASLVSPCCMSCRPAPHHHLEVGTHGLLCPTAFTQCHARGVFVHQAQGVPSCIHAFAVPLVGCVCVLVNVWDGSKAHVEGCRLIIAGQVQHRVVSKALEDDDYDDTRQHESMP